MVRFAEAPDLPVICAIRRQVHQVHVDGRPDIFRMPEDLENYDAFLKDASTNEIFKIFVCENNSTITGYALIRLVTRKDIGILCDRYYYHIEEFGVDESMRGQGFGKELMNGIADCARKDGASSIELGVWGFNEVAEHFYRSLGLKTKETMMEMPL